MVQAAPWAPPNGRRGHPLPAGSSEGRTQSQIAEEIGVSQMHVSRILAQTLRRLREALEPDGEV